MSTHPFLAARLASQRQAELEARAHKHRLRREALSDLMLAKPKIPSRVPRQWRRRSLGRRAFRLSRG